MGKPETLEAAAAKLRETMLEIGRNLVRSARLSAEPDIDQAASATELAEIALGGAAQLMLTTLRLKHIIIPAPQRPYRLRCGRRIL